MKVKSLTQSKLRFKVHFVGLNESKLYLSSPFPTNTGNDNHDSQFALDWLVREFACSDRRAVFKQKVKRRIWEGATFPMEAATTDYQSFMDEDAGLAKVIRSILENGFAMVKGAEHNVDGTRATVERVAPVCQTIYGSMFVLTTDGLKNVSDSSYSTVALGPHTDTTYYQEALG